MGGDDINTLTAVVSKGWAKSKSAIPARGPSVAGVWVGECKAELARGVNRVGGEVVGEAVEARPGLGPANYPVLQCLGQTCTGIVYIQEVLYILHLSRVVLDRTPVM